MTPNNKYAILMMATGLYYLKTRYYDPVLGRFMTIDDIQYLDPETINGLNLSYYWKGYSAIPLSIGLELANYSKDLFGYFKR